MLYRTNGPNREAATSWCHLDSWLLHVLLHEGLYLPPHSRKSTFSNLIRYSANFLRHVENVNVPLCLCVLSLCGRDTWEHDYVHFVHTQRPQLDFEPLPLSFFIVLPGDALLLFWLGYPASELLGSVCLCSSMLAHIAIAIGQHMPNFGCGSRGFEHRSSYFWNQHCYPLNHIPISCIMKNSNVLKRQFPST